MRNWKTVVLLSLVLAAWVRPVLGQDTPVPPDGQASLLSRIIQFDRSSEARSDGGLVVGILFRQDLPASVRVKDEIARVFRDGGIVDAVGRKPVVVEVDLESRLEAVFRGAGLDILYVVPVNDADLVGFLNMALNAKDAMPRVFEPFFSTKDFDDGKGRLSEAVLIPGDETILVVEDEDMVRDLTCSILKRAGYTVLSTSGALEANGVLKNYPSDIHLLLTDVIMPGMTGDLLVEKARPLRPLMAMLFMSGHSGKALEDVANSGLGLVEKPFKAHELVQAVHSALDGDASTAAA